MPGQASPPAKQSELQPLQVTNTNVIAAANSTSSGTPACIQIACSGRHVNAHGSWWSATTSNVSEIRSLKNVAESLMPQGEPMLDPEVFLTSVFKGWRPKVVAVFNDGEPAGILYAKERVISGIPTGVVYADGSLGSFFLASEKLHQNAFCVAMEALVDSPGVRGMRLQVLKDSREWHDVTHFISSTSLDVRSACVERDSRPWKHHAHLALPDTYAGFLERLGGATRHNFRYYRKRFETSGHQFVDALTLEDLGRALYVLQPNSKFHAQMPKAQVEQHFNMVAASRRPLAIGLRHRKGEWMSIIGGWYRPGGAVLHFQCNNERDFGRDSLSTVLRSYLIELLIRQGARELVIWADTGPPLSRYVTYASTIGVGLDVPTRSWRLARRLLLTIGPHLPKRWADAADWIC